MTTATSTPSRAMRFIVRIVIPLWDALRYSSPLPVRFFLSISSLLWCIFLLSGVHAIESDPVYMAPRGAWAALFGLNGLLLAWRIFDTKARIGITRIINASTVALWLIFLGVTLETYGCLPPDSGDEIGTLLAAIWTTLRTSLTVGDRGSA